MTRTPPRRTEIEYPTSDGKPMDETDRHLNLMFRVIQLLRDFFATDPNVYISGNLLLFYEKGNKRKHVSPDCFVVFGVPKKDRDNYLIWEERRAPDIAIEFTSKSTRREDVKKKFALYRDVLKVKEYVLFDPLSQYLNPPLQGYRLSHGEYVPIPKQLSRLPSKVLGLEFEPDGAQLKIWNPETKAYLLTASEQAAAKDQEILRLQAELYRLHYAQKNGGTKNGK